MNQNDLYVDYKTMSVAVPNGTTYFDLFDILFKGLKLRPKNYTITIKYVVEFGTPPVKVLDDLAIDF